ncbi:unnamed protein product [Closterium sp. Naga37s-1]|nr:unnamed protein product [Closterium sp. Naga37s-1]
MPENNFSGPIPPGLFRLPALRHVDLNTISPYPYFLFQNEGLSGSLPDGPDAYSPSLETVILYGNALSRELPRALLHAPALSRLDLQSNNIAGELPGEAGAYSQSITALILRNNSLSGAIRPALAEMTALRKLNLGGNRLSSAVLASLLDSESLKALDEVRLDNNALTGPFCNALLPARELWLGFNDLGGATAGSSASATGGGDGGGGGEEEEGGGSLHGCMLPAKLEILSAPYAGLRGSVSPELFLATNAQSGRKPSMGGLGRIIRIDLSYNNLSGSLKALTVLPTGVLDLSHNNFSGGIPEAFFSGGFSLADLRFNELSGPLFDTCREDWSYDWDRLRVSDNSARMAGTVGAGYIPVPAPGVQVSATETEALLAVRDALLGKAAGGTEFADGGSSSWGEILRSWDASSSSACGWYGVGCTADGHVDTLHLLGNAYVTLHPNFVPESPDCEHTQCGDKICADADPRPPPQVQFFLEGLPGGSSNSRASADGSLSEAVGQLTHLTSLRISGHALSGGLPPSLSRLSHLVALDLSSNRHLSGSIPPALFALPSLRELSLRENNLTGEVLPTTAAAAASAAAALSPSLESLDVGGNALSRSIPADVGLLTGLTRLALDQNRLDGSLPRELGALWTLTDLHLQGNALQGDVSTLAAAFPPPPAPADPTASSAPVLWGLRGVFPLLTRVDVSSNEVSGDAAVLFPLPQGLLMLNLPNNRLTQSFSLEFLSHLDLSSNKLTGSISNALVTGLTALSHLDLSKNLLSGSLPRSLAAIAPLTHLDLSRNKLKGSLPAFCQGKQSLASLLLSSNTFSGPLSSLLPSSSSCASSLLLLDVSTNQLSSSLPSSLSRFTALHSLLAARNRMSGSIPARLASLTALQELDVSWSGLSGTIPALLRAAAPSLQVHLAGNALSGSVPPSLSDLPTSCFRPGNPKLCGKPLPACKKRSSKPRKGRL